MNFVFLKMNICAYTIGLFCPLHIVRAKCLYYKMASKANTDNGTNKFYSISNIELNCTLFDSFYEFDIILNYWTFAYIVPLKFSQGYFLLNSVNNVCQI